MAVEGLEALRIARRPEAQRRPSGSRKVVAFVAMGFGVVLAIGASVYTLSARTLGRPLEVKTALVVSRSPGAPEVVLTGSGYVVTRHKYITVGTKIQGQIVSEPIEEGQTVARGDLLAQIDDRDYQDQLRQAVAERDLAAANLRLAQAKMDRRRDLLGDHSVSKEEYDIAVNDADVAEATLRRDQAAVDYARFQVEQCRITSPIDGIVLQKYREVGATINYSGQGQSSTGATDIAQLADTRDMRAEVDVNESDIAKLSLGMAGAIVPDAYPRARFDARLVKIYPEADRQKATVKVEVHIEKPDLTIIKPEMSVKAEFVGRDSARGASGLVVPSSALVREANVAYVWIIRSGVARKIRVELGGDADGGVEVRQGIADGDSVILAPPADLRDGQPVRPATST